MTTLIQSIVNGMATGCLYALIAMGFVIIYKATGVLNFAQGELMMVCSFFCYWAFVELHLPVWLVILLTIVFAFTLGYTIETIILRPMIGEPLFSVIIVTIGISMLIVSGVGMTWGHGEFVFPKWVTETPLHLSGVIIGPMQLVLAGAVVVLGISYFIFLRKTNVGLAMMAVASNQDTALLMGVNVKMIFALSWCIAAGVATIAGVLFASVLILDMNMRFIAFRAFPAAVLGGLDSIPGAILGGLFIGVTENLAGVYLDHFFGGGIKEITAFIILLLILLIRPYGLLGTKEIERV